MDIMSSSKIKLFKDTVISCKLIDVTYGIYPVSIKAKIKLKRSGNITAIFYIGKYLTHYDFDIEIKTDNKVTFISNEEKRNLCWHLWIMYCSIAYKNFYGVLKSKSKKRILARNLKWLREEKGLSIEKGAKAINIDLQILEKIEKGEAYQKDTRKLNYKLMKEVYNVSKRGLWDSKIFCTGSEI